MYIETANLVRHIHKIDPKALTIVTDVKTIDGFMKIYRQGSID
jgi:uncharacterized membrane-anchored protein YitT (DUF2179 family)